MALALILAAQVQQEDEDLFTLHTRVKRVQEKFRGDFRGLFRDDMADSLKSLTQATAEDAETVQYDGSNILEYILLPNYLSSYSESSVSSTDTCTLFTQLSIERIHMLEGLFKAWPGPMSIAIYIQDPEWLDESYGLDVEFDSQHPLNPLYQSLRQSGHSKTDIHLVFGYAFTADPMISHQPYDMFYPVNTMRNIALTECRTDFVLGLDVDFLPSAGLYQSLLEKREWIVETLSPDQGTVLIVPAFELLSEESAESIEDDKWSIKTFMQECSKGRVIPFHSKRIINVKSIDSAKALQWCEGKLKKYHVQLTNVQASTNFNKWLSIAACSKDRFMQDSWTDSVYQAKVGRVESANGYRLKLDRFFEPYVIGHRKTLGLYDDRFRGYSFNKRSHITQLQYQMCTFLVHPAAFVIHREHSFSQSNLFWHQSKQHTKKLGTSNLRTGAEGVVERIYRSFLASYKKAYIKSKKTTVAEAEGLVEEYLEVQVNNNFRSQLKRLLWFSIEMV